MQISKAILLLLTICVSQVASINISLPHLKCLQCSGSITVTVDGGLSFLSNIDTFIRGVIPFCASGTDFLLTSGEAQSCDPGQGNSCKFFTFSLQAWRFCHPGGNAQFDKHYSAHIADFKGSITLLYNLNCTKSVACGITSCLLC